MQNVEMINTLCTSIDLHTFLFIVRKQPKSFSPKNSITAVVTVDPLGILNSDLVHSTNNTSASSAFAIIKQCYISLQCGIMFSGCLSSIVTEIYVQVYTFRIWIGLQELNTIGCKICIVGVILRKNDFICYFKFDIYWSFFNIHTAIPAKYFCQTKASIPYKRQICQKITNYI